MTELKKWITTALLTLLLLPAMAQQKADTTYTFRNPTDIISTTLHAFSDFCYFYILNPKKKKSITEK